tara:strand:- start:3118 stop:3819 length:702 start_codon:yes stop_codon:yes gene_type:complete
MKNNSENKTLLFVNLDKFKIVVLDELDEVIFKRELLLKASSEKFSFELFEEFINQNIFKIEKELNEFVKTIILIIDHYDIFSVNLSIKNKMNDVLLNTNLINNLLIEAKSCCKETLEKMEVMHMKIDQFYIDNNVYEILPDKVRFKNLSVDLSFICIPNNFLQNLEKVLKKYQISVGKALSYKYLNTFIDISNNELSLVSKKILNGFNQNEVSFINKRSKNLSFFEKFFNFFN